jgi:hypothetical protein
MATLTEGKHAEGFLVEEGARYRSRLNITVLSGQNLKAGHVVGRVLGTSLSQVYTGTGNGVLTPDATTPTLAGVQEGRYTAVCIEPGTNVGTFEVADPQGNVLGRHIVDGTAFSNQIKFAIADGSTDFVSGDMFELYVKAGSIAAGGGNTGNGVGTLYQTMEGVQHGAYALVCTAAITNSGTFSVTAPDGTSVGALTVGTRYIQGGLDLLIADGSADFIVGDTFTVTVTRGKVKEYAPTNTDGSGKVFGALTAPTGLLAADAKGVVIVRDAIVNAAEVEWFSGATAGQKTAGLEALELMGVLAR